MLYSSILIQLAVFLQISTKVLRKIQPDYGNFHRSGHFSCLGDDGDDDADHSIFPKRWKVQQLPCQYSPLDDDDDNDDDNYDEY